MILFLNSLAHFLVDAICVTTLFPGDFVGRELTAALILYNTLAFSTQCLFGLLLDRCPRYPLWNALAVLLVVLGFLLPLPDTARISIAALGNSFFHVAAGTITLTNSRGRAWQLGIFVAPGAFGVTLGTCFPLYGRFLCGALVLCTAAAFFCSKRIESAKNTEVPVLQPYSEGLPVSAIVLLTASVSVRAFGGTAVVFPWKTGAGMAFLMTAFVFAGKLLGGFLCDRFGAARSAWFSIPIAAICIAFFSDHAAASLLGQLLLNLTMPVTLWLLYLAMPNEPALAFGLAASALWPGTIAGMLVPHSGPGLRVCVIFSFLFGLIAIMIAGKKLRTERGGRE